MAVTIVDIAKRLNISHATVSRVLDGRNTHLISEGTSLRVLSAAREMGYRPNRIARALSTGKSNLIALSLPDLATPFFGQILKSVQRCIKKDGFDLIPLENVTSVSLLGWPVDGGLSFGAVAKVGRFIEDSKEMNIPVVSMGSTYDDEVDFVSVDLYDASRDAVRHLLETGRKRVAFVVLRMDVYKGSRRYDAYMDTMQEAGVEPEIIAVPELTKPSVRKTIHDYTNANGFPDGLFCMNDDYALGALRALKDLGLRVPEDVGLVGCDGIEDTQYSDPPITTIVQPAEEICLQAWDFLYRRLQDPTVPRQSARLHSRLEIRGSSVPQRSASLKGG